MTNRIKEKTWQKISSLDQDLILWEADNQLNSTVSGGLLDIRDFIDLEDITTDEDNLLGDEDFWNKNNCWWNGHAAATSMWTRTNSIADYEMEAKLDKRVKECNINDACKKMKVKSRSWIFGRLLSSSSTTGNRRKWK